MESPLALVGAVRCDGDHKNVSFETGAPERTPEPITSEQATKWAALLLIPGADLQVVKVKLPARVACKSMNHAQKYLVQANQQIAELTVQAARQRVIVKDALDAGQRSEMAESLLDALEGSLRIFEKHRIFLLSCNKRSILAP